MSDNISQDSTTDKFAEFTKSRISELWPNALFNMTGNFQAAVYDTVIRRLVPVCIEDGYLIIKAEDGYFLHQLEGRYLEGVVRSVRAVIHPDLRVKFVSPDDFDKQGNRIVRTSDMLAKKANLISKYVFDSFVKGKSNEFAYSAAMAVAEAPGQTSYNPLFFYGDVGLGKTHLMHAIGNHALKNNPELRVMYVSSEMFTNELIASLGDKKNQEFRTKYRELDLLMIDDIQFIVGKEATQEEVFHTFNTLYSANKQIVLSSDQPPGAIKLLESRLRSRFGSGLIVDVTLPDFETRVAILEKKAIIDQISMPQDVTRYIASTVVSNIRELEGALTKVTAEAKLTNSEVDVAMAEKALSNIVFGTVKRAVSVDYIKEVVAREFSVTIDDIVGKQRTASVALARQICMFLSRKLMNMPYPKIGEQFGGRDHSTIMHGCEKIEKDIVSDEYTKEMVSKIEKELIG
jgi:chromosomal replication initiator protein